MSNNSLIVLALLILFVILEHLFPLRKRRDHFKRLLYNLALAILALPITRLFTLPLIVFVVYTANARSFGILNILKLNTTTHYVLGFLILDYALYWWHVANHKISIFWRFHQVHHADRDMDATTALRFHFGELILAALVRCLLVLIVGLNIETIIIFDLLVTSAALFHHSNLKLPHGLENFVSLIIVTPSYHQNHHSYFRAETDSNYSTIFSFWDRLFHSYTRLNKAEDITIGHPAFIANELQFTELIKMPFKKMRNWPEDFIKRSITPQK